MITNIIINDVTKHTELINVHFIWFYILKRCGLSILWIQQFYFKFTILRKFCFLLKRIKGKTFASL